MGFWEENEDLTADAGSFLKGADKAVLIKTGATFIVNAVALVESRFEEGEQQYVLDVTIPEGIKGLEEKAGEQRMGFAEGSVRSRDVTLGRMAKYLDDPSNGGIEATLILVGRSQLVRPAGE